MLSCLFTLLGCAVETPPLEEPDVDDNHEAVLNENITVGLSMDTLIEERWHKDRDMFSEAVRGQGADIIVRAANGNDALQIAQAERMITDGVDVLVLVPHNAEAAATIVGRAQAAGIPVISYDRLVKNANIDLYISFDNKEVGRLQAKAMLEAVPSGQYVYIGGANTDNNAHLMREGVYEVLKPHIDAGKIQVVYDEWTDAWRPKEAKKNMLAALKANDHKIDAIIAANDATAGGAIEALTEAGIKKQIPIVGQDAELQGIKRLFTEEQLMTVYKSINELTEKAAEMAIKLARGEPIETNHVINNGKKDVPTIYLTPVTVTKDNIEETVIKDGFHDAEDIYSD
ncbi:sugar ABC transporter substrate-binding protein [Halolactibacillus alkaliphilus]